MNINYVHGFDDKRAQIWMPPLTWLALLMIVMPLVVFWPTHWALKRLVRPADELHRQ